jgi:hypothetical protein
MKIKYFSPVDTEKNLKCTIHITGKLGFSRNAIKQLGIEGSKYIKLGLNEDNKDDKSLYMVIQSEKDVQSFKINKAGNYYYLNTKHLFDEMGIEYKKNKVIYDIMDVEIDDTKMYKLSMRILERRKKVRSL